MSFGQCRKMSCDIFRHTKYDKKRPNITKEIEVGKIVNCYLSMKRRKFIKNHLADDFSQLTKLTIFSYNAKLPKDSHD